VASTTVGAKKSNMVFSLLAPEVSSSLDATELLTADPLLFRSSPRMCPLEGRSRLAHVPEPNSHYYITAMLSPAHRRRHRFRFCWRTTRLSSQPTRTLLSYTHVSFWESRLVGCIGRGPWKLRLDSKRTGMWMSLL
jgi:hypothetical protein